MSWRNSRFFEGQFARMQSLGGGEHEASFAADILNSTNDLPLMVFSDWLEEQNDARADYIRDMCELSRLTMCDDSILERVNAFEGALTPSPSIYFRSLVGCTLLMAAGDSGIPNPALVAELRRYMHDNPDLPLVLDLRELKSVSSESLGLLLQLSRSATGQNLRVPLCLTRDGAVWEIMVITALDQIFHVTDSLAAAIEMATSG